MSKEAPEGETHNRSPNHDRAKCTVVDDETGGGLMVGADQTPLISSYKPTHVKF